MSYKRNELVRNVVVSVFKRSHWAVPACVKKLPMCLSEQKACSVLITCGMPSEEGKMQVEMTYEGDATLAAFLIESAHAMIENRTEAL